MDKLYGVSPENFTPPEVREAGSDLSDNSSSPGKRKKASDTLNEWQKVLEDKPLHTNTDV